MKHIFDLSGLRPSSVLWISGFLGSCLTVLWSLCADPSSTWPAPLHLGLTSVLRSARASHLLPGQCLSLARHSWCCPAPAASVMTGARPGNGSWTHGCSRGSGSGSTSLTSGSPPPSHRTRQEGIPTSQCRWVL